MKKIFILLFTLLLTYSSFSQEEFKRVSIKLQNNVLADIVRHGIDVNEGSHKPGYSFETDLSTGEIERLKNAGFQMDVLIEDVSAFYAERLNRQGSRMVDRDISETWPVPENWKYGSMGGYYTLDEAYSEIDSMVVLYPDLISARLSISDDTLTHEGRKLFWLKISDNPNDNEDEPELLYTAIHHAREPISIQQLIYYMWYLLENYGTDPVIEHIVDNTEMYFVPFINPDGYQHNVVNDPNGGGMWRKNRRDNGDGSFGVDPNRNYGYMWGLNDDGSSPWPPDATYRGPAAFSEPEIKNMRDFCNEHEFQIALNYHSHGNLLLAPWSYTPEPPPDYDLLMAYGDVLTRENSYFYGPGNTAIYPTNGGSDDWMYGEQETKELIYSYTPEVGNSIDGFWPAVDRIIPLCKEQMWQNITAARLVGRYAVLQNLGPVVTGEVDNYASFGVTRLGLTDSETITVAIEPLDEHIIDYGEPLMFENMNLLDSAVDSIGFMLDAGIENGTIFKYLLSIDDGDLVTSDTITMVFGTEMIVFEDDMEDLIMWSSEKWNTVTSDFHSADHSMTDSPDGEYDDQESNEIILDSVIDLRNVSTAFLRFWAKWELEKNFDYVQVLVKDIDDETWVSLGGKYTQQGNSYLGPEESLYDGFQTEWVQEEISLFGFVGKQISLRFILVSDRYVEEDGFYFDDLIVSVISSITGIEPEREKETGIFISDAYPNPAKDEFRVQYELERNDGAMLELFDALGKKLQLVKLDGEKGVVSVHITDLTNGIYFYRLTNGNKKSGIRRLIKF